MSFREYECVPSFVEDSDEDESEEESSIDDDTSEDDSFSDSSTVASDDPPFVPSDLELEVATIIARETWERDLTVDSVQRIGFWRK